MIKNGPGSLVRLPLGVHQAVGKVFPFITADGTPLARSWRDQITLLGNPNRISMDYINFILARIPPEPEKPEPAPLPRKRKGEGQYTEPLSETLKQAISVYDFVSRYIELDQNAKGFCPFHDDQKKSFQVNIKNNYWHCYAGCKGKTIIDFWMLWREQQGEDASFQATIKDLRHMLLK